MNSAQKLQLELRPGDQIIATSDAHYESGEFSQRVGDIIMVNNTRVSRDSDGEIYHISDIVSGTGLNGVAYNGRECLGLGGSLRVGTFRRATPDDPGFMATREQWSAIKDAEIERLRAKLFAFGVVGVVWFGTMLMMGVA